MFSLLSPSLRYGLFGLLTTSFLIPAPFAAAIAASLPHPIALSEPAPAPTHDNQLVHITGAAQTSQPLADPYLGVTEPALRLRRTVEMYQWQETIPPNGTPTYAPVWSETLIPSELFHTPQGHQNPSSMPLKTEIFTASGAKIGGFTLSEAFLAAQNQWQPYPLTPTHYETMHPSLKKSLRLEDGQYRYGSSTTPEIGAMRMYFSIIPAGPISVIAQQSGSTLVPFPSSTGPVALLALGTQTAEAMLPSEAPANTDSTPLLAGIGGAALLGSALLLRQRRKRRATQAPENNPFALHPSLERLYNTHPLETEEEEKEEDTDTLPETPQPEEQLPIAANDATTEAPEAPITTADEEPHDKTEEEAPPRPQPPAPPPSEPAPTRIPAPPPPPPSE